MLGLPLPFSFLDIPPILILYLYYELEAKCTSVTTLSFAYMLFMISPWKESVIVGQGIDWTAAEARELPLSR
jgi:hypothetical protein